MTDPSRDKDTRRFFREMDRLQRHLPGFLASVLVFLRRPNAWMVRTPIGVLLVIGGLLSFLPVLGIWMLPLGLLLIAVDLPPLRGPLSRILIRGENWLRRRRNGKKARDAAREKERPSP